MALSLFDPAFEDWVFGPLALRNTTNATNALTLRVDFKEEGDKFLLHADVPGCNKEDVHVEVHDRTLTITAERKREETKDTDKYHRVERQYGKVTRSLRLPESANTTSVAAQYDNGVLTVTIPKLAPEAQTPKSRRITVE